MLRRGGECLHGLQQMRCTTGKLISRSNSQMLQIPPAFVSLHFSSYCCFSFWDSACCFGSTQAHLLPITLWWIQESGGKIAHYKAGRAAFLHFLPLNMINNDRRASVEKVFYFWCFHIIIHLDSSHSFYISTLTSRVTFSVPSNVSMKFLKITTEDLAHCRQILMWCGGSLFICFNIRVTSVPTLSKQSFQLIGILYTKISCRQQNKINHSVRLHKNNICVWGGAGSKRWSFSSLKTATNLSQTKDELSVTLTLGSWLALC